MRLAERNKRTETQQSSHASRDFSSVLFICFYFLSFFFLKEKEDQGEDTVSENKSKTKQAHFFFYSSA